MPYDDPLSMPDNSMNKQSAQSSNPGIDSHDPIVKAVPPQEKPKGVIARAIEDAAQESLQRYILPNVFDGLYNIITGFFSLLLRQDSRPVVRGSRGRDDREYRGAWVSYGDIYDSKTSRNRESARREREAASRVGRADIQMMSYYSLDDALDVYDRIRDYLGSRDCVSVARIYEWSNQADEMPNTARKWGFYEKDLKDIKVEEDPVTKRGYIYFPRVKQLPDD